MGLDYEQSTPEQLLEAQKRVAIQSTQHLIEWLQVTNRGFLVLKTEDLVRSLEDLPEGLDVLQMIINVYGGHRKAQHTGDYREETLSSGETMMVPIFKDDRLTTDEMKEAVYTLLRELADRDPTWVP